MTRRNEYKKIVVLFLLISLVLVLSLFFFRAVSQEQELFNVDFIENNEIQKKLIANEQQEETQPVDVQEEQLDIENYTIHSNIIGEDPVIAIRNLENTLIEYYQFEQENLTKEQIYLINHSVMAIIRSTLYSDVGTNKAALMWRVLAGETPDELQSLLIELSHSPEEQSKTKENKEKSIGTGDITLSSNELVRAIENVLKIEILELTPKQSKETSENSWIRKVDFQHMIATTNALTHKTEMDEASELVFDVLTGWGGDLLTFSQEVSSHFLANTTLAESELTDFVSSTLGTMESRSFNSEDLYADIDSVNIAELLLTHNVLLSEGILWYYDSWMTNRVDDFIEYYGGEESFYELVRLLINYDTINQADIVYHTIKADTLKGILMIFHKEFLDTKLSDIERESLYKGFVYVLRGEFPK
jgi:hypothetical protein